MIDAVRNRWLAPAATSVVLSLVAGCGDGGGSGGGDGPSLDPDPTVRENAGPAEREPARRVKRLTAEQFHESLEIATGARWSRYEQFASSLGRPDYAEITAQGLEASVTFDKLVHDAARETCAVGVLEDARRPVPGTERILRHATLSDRHPDVLRENLQYLLLRFHAVDVAADDPRIDPYLDLLVDPPPTSDFGMRARWVAVCVALVTHPDFLTY